MKIIRVLNQNEFEVEGELVVGELVRSKDVIAIVTSAYQEESEYSEYLDRLETEEIKKFLPDLIEGKRIARCLALCNLELEDVFNLPKIGEKVDKINEKEIRSIHFKNGELRIPYLIKLLRSSNLDVAKRLILRLIDAIPEEREVLEIILAEIEYKRMKGVEL